MSARGSYYPGNVNMYVPNMSYAADVHIEGKLTVDLTPSVAPVAASGTAILNAVAGASSILYPATTLKQDESLFGRFGRALVIVASGANANAVIVHGQDYLGQPMSEQVTLNGTTAVNMLKAFRRITKVDCSAVTGVNVSLGVRDVFGLPYALLDAAVDFVNGAKAGTQGTYVTPALTAQTATSGDPRGTFAPNTASNGSNKYSLMYEARRGDLYGQKHFFNG